MTLEHDADVAYYEAEVRQVREVSLNPEEWPQLDAEIKRLSEVRSLIQSLSADPAYCKHGPFDGGTCGMCKADRVASLLAAYRAKRSVDGFNGRVWDAVRHADAEREIERLEAQLFGRGVDVLHSSASAKAATVSEPTDRKRRTHLAHCPAHPHIAMCICDDEPTAPDHD